MAVEEGGLELVQAEHKVAWVSSEHVKARQAEILARNADHVSQRANKLDLAISAEDGIPSLTVLRVTKLR